MSYDGFVTVVGCDKNMPGALMAMLRVNRPSILVYGGTIESGNHNGKKLDVVSAFEAWGQKVAGKISQIESYKSSLLTPLSPLNWNKITEQIIWTWR